MNDIRFDSDDQQKAGQSARVVVGDVLAWVGRPLRSTFQLNQPTLTLSGLSKTARVGPQTFDPISLASRRLAPIQGCFPLPAADATWARAFPLQIRSASATQSGRLPIKNLEVRGHLIAKGGWIQSGRSDISFRSRDANESYTFTLHTVYELEVGE